jgi:type I restriction enzyme, S subunit
MRLPPGWTTASFADITVERVDQREPSARQVSYIDIGSINRDLKVIGETQQVTARTAPTRARQWVRSGDVLVSMTRPNLNAVALVPSALDGAVASTGFDVLRPLGVLPEWVYYRVRSQAFVQEVCADVQGVVYPAIRPADVRRHEIPLPPAGEQRRIVDVVESYLSRIDVAVAGLETTHTGLRVYRASVLNAAVEGRLVPTEAELARKDGQSYESVEILLARILKERRRRWEETELARMKAAGKTKKDATWKARYEEPPPPDKRSLPELPEGWCWARAEQLSEFITKGTTPRNDGMTAGSGEIPYVKVYNLTFDGTLNFAKAPTFVTRDTHEGFLARSICISGDVLMNLVGPPLGKVSILPPSFAEWNINQAIARYRPISGVDRRFLAYALLEDHTLRWARKRAKTTAGQVNLTLEIARDIPVPLPPYEEQVRIVDEIEKQFSMASATTSMVVNGLSRCRRLRQAILKWAFEGKLVDQDSADEPAEQLLARIRASRRVAVTTTKVRVRSLKTAS